MCSNDNLYFSRQSINIRLLYFIEKKIHHKKFRTSLEQAYLRSIAGREQAFEQATSATESACSRVVQTHFAQPLEQALSQGFVQPLRTRPRKAAMGPEPQMESARTSYVQATYKPAYKHRTRSRHFRIYSRTRLRTRTSNKGSNKLLRTTIRTKIFEQARTRFEQRIFFP